MGEVLRLAESILPVEARGPSVHVGARTPVCSGGNRPCEQRSTSGLCPYESSDQRAGQRTKHDRKADGIIYVSRCRPRSLADPARRDRGGYVIGQLLRAGKNV